MSTSQQTPRAWPTDVLGRLPVRARLAVWHVTAVAIVLLAFAAATSRHLRRTHADRIDASLIETADLVSQVLRHEANDEHAPIDVAVESGAREVRYRDRRVVIVDTAGRVLARSDSIPLGSFMLSGAVLAGPPAVTHLLRVARDSARAFVSVGVAAAPTRILAIHTAYLGTPITLLVARELAGEDADTDAFVRWLYWMIPMALVVAGGLGYLLVRQSLAPALAMARQAERIGAAGLDSRLEFVNAHDELGQLGTVLNQLLSRLQAAFGQQQRFMADASHELRTPIAVVRSAADVVLHAGDAPPEALREALDTIRSEGRRMTRIVDDLFLLARADSAQQPVHRERLFLEELVADVAKAGRLLGRTTNVAVVANTAEEAPFDGDATLLMRMLMNLVDNAIKFSPADTTVRLDLSIGTAVARDGTGGPLYRIVVADEGPGVARARSRRPSSAGSFEATGRVVPAAPPARRGRPRPRHRALDRRGAWGTHSSGHHGAVGRGLRRRAAAPLPSTPGDGRCTARCARFSGKTDMSTGAGRSMEVSR